MSQNAPAERKVLVVKRDLCATLPNQQVDRRFLIELRRALLQQLIVIERQLEITQRCRNCGYELTR